MLTIALLVVVTAFTIAFMAVTAMEILAGLTNQE